jgi:hypothetical protein
MPTTPTPEEQADAIVDRVLAAYLELMDFGTTRGEAPDASRLEAGAEMREALDDLGDLVPDDLLDPSPTLTAMLRLGRENPDALDWFAGLAVDKLGRLRRRRAA